MKGCRPGDVILAPFSLGNSTYPRPLVILSVTGEGTLLVCPFTSKRPIDKPAIACAIHDFHAGGLDLFEDSYILIHEQRTITERSVRHKKGTLEPDYFRTLLESAHSLW
ncbi:type II toxin-antitoxin system PemK/MazF family toxin [Methanogenium organophilum]|uniref:Type II toxin-antitoxin system PemK/MazF family toxin n=1 Tax=Methanogenium organophilum TaxID=2199 RepID=A0A9X9S4L8_METOG|nr:type II toxin-antitoxin system PemK/MazF family toxin [Methanogenium organophilum]WAI01683.1 type II toxin-antitoxin system PemK/MazF family toxin [Methanogenium organophilum]